MIETHIFRCRTDNYGALLRDAETGVVALVDAPEDAPILRAIEETGWTPTILLTTHHHADHVAANLALKERFGLTIVGPAREAEKIPGIDRTVRDGDTLVLGSERVTVIETPGHTAGHVSYYLEQAHILFSADTLFSLGCGRLFECGADVMRNSLQKLMALPEDTLIFCGHEYTLSNARFALTVDPENTELKARAQEVEQQAREGRFSIPVTLAQELRTNPFLRWDDPSIRKTLGMETAHADAVFAEIRHRKDNF